MIKNSHAMLVLTPLTRMVFRRDACSARSWWVRSVARWVRLEWSTSHAHATVLKEIKSTRSESRASRLAGEGHSIARVRYLDHDRHLRRGRARDTTVLWRRLRWVGGVASMQMTPKDQVHKVKMSRMVSNWGGPPDWSSTIVDSIESLSPGTSTFEAALARTLVTFNRGARGGHT